jgi:hypothetical protein
MPKGKTAWSQGDVNVFDRNYGRLRRRLKGQVVFLRRQRLAELELLEEMGKLNPYDERELARLRAPETS